MYQHHINIINGGRNSPSNRRIRWIMPAACYRDFDGSTILAELLSRINYREILGSGSLSFKARLGIEREMMDQLFPRALLSTYPFSPRSWDGRQTVGASGKGRRGRGKNEEGREKRETETKLPDYLLPWSPYDPLCQWRSNVNYRFDSLKMEGSNENRGTSFTY